MDMADTGAIAGVLMMVGAGSAAAFVVAQITAFSANAAPRAVADDGASGWIRVLRPLALAFTVPALLAAAYFLYSAASYPEWREYLIPDHPPYLWFGLGALAVAVLCAAALHPAYDLRWDAFGIEGPSSLFPPPFGPRPQRIAWDQIAVAGRGATCWFVQASDGRQVCWNESYGGFPALMARIEVRCPWLFDEADSPEA